MNRFKRKLKLGVVGGGSDSFIGPVHRMAARMSNYYDLVTGVLSSNAEKSRKYAMDVGIAKERAYGNWKELIEQEKNRSDGIDVLAIMTPNDSHYEIALAALDANMHVICDKPLCNSLKNAIQLVQKTEEKDKVFCVTYNYSAYPMVRQARAMVKNGDLGEIRQVHMQYIQSHLAGSNVNTGWRFDTKKGGPSLVVSDIATHAYHLGCYVTDLEVDKLISDLGTNVPGRKVDDYLSCLLRFDNGARGSMWITNSAAGAEHGLSFKIFGEKGGLQWHQEHPNELRHRRLDGFEQIMTRRKDGKLYPEAESSMSLEIGHPEGFHDAFANLYREVAEAIFDKENTVRSDTGKTSFPTVKDGAKGVRFIYAVLDSSKNGSWTNCRLNLCIKHEI